MSIYIENETDYEIDFDYEELINKVINYSLDFIKCPYEVEINVVLTDNDGIWKVNKEFRDMDKPTDVLSFPMLEYECAGDFDCIYEEDDSLFNPETGELLLGDIMISLDKVDEQAKEYGHSKVREMGFLIAHSMLHLFGFDHMEDDERLQMESMQKQIMDDLEIYR